MLETVSKGFRAAGKRLSGSTLDDTAVEAAVKDIRLSLLEADVDLDVVKRFIGRVRERAKADLAKGSDHFLRDGQRVDITPYHRFIAICQEELESLMGGEPAAVEYAPLGVTAIMMVGLQGSGKTTTSAKLARYFKERESKRVLLVAADLQRPAAVEQLQTLGKQVDVPVFSKLGATADELCGEALAYAGKTKRDVVIFDTAGRLAIDETLMAELQTIKDRTKPQEILFVVDAMVGQDAVRTAKAFDEALTTTGFVMTKLDGDARGGAALSIREVTGRPIKFLGTGEGTGALELFRPEGLASRVLGMGDVLGLVGEYERHIDQEKAEDDADRMFRGQFDMADFVEQIRTLQKMGSLTELLEKMPVMQPGMRPDERELHKIVAVHDSMTPTERRRPALAREPSRLRRLGRGTGRGEPVVREVLDKFDTMRRMMIALGDQPSLLAKIPGLQQLAQVRQLRGLDLSEIFGDEFAEALAPPAPEPEVEEPLPAPETRQSGGREYFANWGKPTSEKRKSDKAKERRKKKLAQKARKKNRR